MAKLTKEQQHIMESYFFKYVTLAHFILASTYVSSYLSYFKMLLNYSSVDSLLNKDISKLAYAGGHIVLSINFLLISIIFDSSNSNVSPEHDIRTKVLGVLGHTMLLLYSVMSLNKHGIHPKMVIFLMLQMGMIYFYLTNEKADEPISSLKINNKQILYRDLYIGIFASLALLYVYMALHTHETYKYGLWILASVYLYLVIFWKYYRVDT